MRQAGTQVAPGIQVPSGIQVGHGTRPVATRQLFTTGSFVETGNDLDIAIEGDGFFQVLLPDGTTGYTRDGSFKRDVTGQMVTSDGYPMEPAITILDNSRNITVGKDGTISGVVGSDSTATNFGQINLAIFPNPGGLSRAGSNIFKETDASGTPTVTTPGTDGMGITVGQFLEYSNVQVVEEMVNLIVAQRAYEVNSKTIQATDEMLQQANNLRR